MFVSVVLFGMGASKGRMRSWLRHPMLTGFIVWAVAHLLVNGDVASIVLFGGLLAWAVIAVIGINRRDGPRGPLPEATSKGLAIHIGVGVVVFLVVGWLHGLLGAWPFPG
jgi:uncharacterized membrane protein